ncbi:bifunctional diaminohydroxyphosphoribosylaminopyrimidine deaminase/5-amino-6-(5-phosphoribosylamino)uracil reductase RibD [Donghicola sp. XS_ASV15]
MDRHQDRRFMALALSLGRRGMGNAWPNPAVGCVLAHGARIVGRGWTQPGGRPHAEVVALAQAGPEARGATAYVTLEPCAHFGKTPPCANALIEAGVARVVVAATDTDPRVAGQGIAKLRDAGIPVETGLMEAEALEDLSGFFFRLAKGRPRVTLKLASSFDGRIATASGESQWITGPAARRHVHGMRMRHDAVMVGGGTARADDPQLTVRDMGVSHQPTRVIVSRKLDLPRAGRMWQSIPEVPMILCHGPNLPEDTLAPWRDQGGTLVECALDGRRVDVQSVLQGLGDHGLTRVFCEGGGALAGSFLQADLVDELVGYTAGLALGAEGQPAIGAMGLDALAEAPRFDLVETRPIGPDVLHRWLRRR